MRGVDIVIPVYNARQCAQQCLSSVLRHATGDWRLVVVDDASTESGIAEDLGALARQDPRVCVLTNERNSGFVHSANRGMQVGPDRDVLLLHSDTEVFAGFLEQLRQTAYAADRVGIVVPFSNNATICSLPEFFQANAIPNGYSPESFAQLVSACSRRRRPPLVTPVGFCMFVRREVIERIGYFDEETFERGFGEENDFGERAKGAGFQIRLCDDAFVWHRAKAALGAEALEQSRRNSRRLEAKHPGFHQAVRAFIQANPLAAAQEELRFHLPRLRQGCETTILFVLHSSPYLQSAGGTEFHVLDLVRALALPRVAIAYPSDSDVVVAEVLDGQVSHPTYFRFEVGPHEALSLDQPVMAEVLAQIVRLFAVRAVHIHHLLNWPVTLADQLRRLGIPYAYTFHDYYGACPNWNLFDYNTKQPCQCRAGAPTNADCLDGFLEVNSLSIGVAASEHRRRHREAFRRTFEGAGALIFPSQAARQATERQVSLAGYRVEIVGHGYEAQATVSRKPPGPRLRLAALGGVAAPIKGEENFIELVRRTRGQPVEWHFFGTALGTQMGERLLSMTEPGLVHLHGRYARCDVVDLLVAHGIDLVVIPAPWEETFSYVLSEAVVAGVPSLVLNVGALGERVTRDGTGIAVGNLDQAISTLDSFALDRDLLLPWTERARSFRHRSLHENAAVYRALYESLGWLPGAGASPIDAEALPRLFDRRVDLDVREEPRPQPPSSSLRKPIHLLARPFKSLLPNSIWHFGKQAFGHPPEPALLSLDLGANSGATAYTDLLVLRRRRSATSFESISTDPQILLASFPGFQAASVSRVRLRARRDFEGVQFAQLFWAHAREEAFCEEKSVLIPLDAARGDWADCTVVLRGETSRRWRGGPRIVRLCLRPMNVRGVIHLGPLEFLP